ncbi:ATP-binding protein [Nocardia lasii]|uniref:ATP-binding protein n=1 Tax=Nocardia lasii TaxID=1616107 RepID=A0ABW1JPS8_9NOCA
MEPGLKLTYDGVVREGVGLALGFRHVVCLTACAAWFLTALTPVSRAIAVTVLLVWSSFRLWDRRDGPGWESADLLVILAFLAGPAVTSSSMSTVDDVAFQVAGAAVISFGVAVSWSVSALCCAAIVSALLVGCRDVSNLGVGEALSSYPIQFLVVAAVLATGVRQIVLRAAAAVDSSQAALTRARIDAVVAAARRRHEREQWAILHDTAASTLMLISTGAPVAVDRIAAQAGSDLAVLEAGVPVFVDSGGSPVEVVAMLAEPVRQCRVPVEIGGQPQLWLPTALAWAVVAAVREALTNVERHAEASKVTIVVAEQQLTLFDNGIGIADGSVRSTLRHGIRRSIMERMSAVGATATVTGAVGKGTTVELSWLADTTERGPTEPGHDRDAIDVGRLEAGLIVGVAAICIGDIALQLSRLIGHPGPIPPAWVHLLLAAVNVVCAVVAVAIPRRSPRTNMALMATIVAISVLLCVWVPPSQTGLNWSVGVTGWTIVALGLRRSSRVTTGTVLIWWTLVSGIVVYGTPSLGKLSYMLYLTAGVMYLQIALVSFGSSLHRVVRLVAEQEAQRRAVVAAAAVDTELNHECERRYRRQLKSLLPMLRGIAEGTLRLDSSEVRWNAHTEYSRLRRLLDRVDSMDHPLFADIRDAIDDAEARGVNVVIDTSSELPELSGADREVVAEAIRIMLAGSRSRARLTVVREDDDVAVSVVCDAVGVDLEPRVDQRRVSTQLIVDEDAGTAWLRLRCHQPLGELVPV